MGADAPLGARGGEIEGDAVVEVGHGPGPHSSAFVSAQTFGLRAGAIYRAKVPLVSSGVSSAWLCVFMACWPRIKGPSRGRARERRQGARLHLHRPVRREYVGLGVRHPHVNTHEDTR